MTLEPSDGKRYYAGLRDAILGHGPLPVTPQEGLTVMEVLEAAERSVAQRREVAV